jgi:hypothetical protein
MKTLKFALQSILPVLTVSALMLTASLAICNPAHATEHGKAPKASVSAQPTTASKSITEPKPEIDFRGVLLGVPGQVNALKELCLSDQLAKSQQKPSSAQVDINYCEKEIKVGAKGSSYWDGFSLQYANKTRMFFLKSSDDGAVLQLSGHVSTDEVAALLLFLRERFGTPQAKTIAYRDQMGNRYYFETSIWMDEKSNTIKVIPNEIFKGASVVFNAGTFVQKRAD